MKVSVVVPLYNKAQWVRRTLDSIAAQTFKDFEVIVVDDGSTDGGADVVRSYPDARIRVVHQANAGPGAARNRGIAEARGELIALLDADDAWKPEFLERSVAALEAAGPDVAATVCGYFEYPRGISRERHWRRRGVRDELLAVTPGMSPRRLVHLLAYMNPWATVVRKQVIEKHGGFFARYRCLYGEDAHLWLKVLLNERVLFRTEPLVCFHTEASGLSKNLKRARPVEPFLQFPEELEASCPRELRALLRNVLSIRASRTACMLTSWGHHDQAAQLLERFAEARTVLQPWAVVAKLAARPLGGRVAQTIRRMRGQAIPATTVAPTVPSVPAVQAPQPRRQVPLSLSKNDVLHLRMHIAEDRLPSGSRTVFSAPLFDPTGPSTTQPTQAET